MPNANNLTVSVEQATQTALAGWISSQLSDCTVYDRPTNAVTELVPPGTITILQAGERKEILLDPVPYLVNQVSGNQALYAWKMSALDVPLQIDVWSISDDWRDDILNRMDSALKAGHGATQGAANADPFRHGVAVNLGGGYNGWVADCFFWSSQRISTSNTVQQTEYRGILRGMAHVDIMLTATSYRMLSGKLKIKPHEALVAPSSLLFDIYTITNQQPAPPRGPFAGYSYGP